MQHWRVESAEVWEDLLDMPYGAFADHYQDSKQRKIKDLAAILVADDFNKDPSIDAKAHFAEIKKLPLDELYKRIGELHQPTAKKKKVPQAT